MHEVSLPTPALHGMHPSSYPPQPPRRHHALPLNS